MCRRFIQEPLDSLSDPPLCSSSHLSVWNSKWSVWNSKWKLRCSVLVHDTNTSSNP